MTWLARQMQTRSTTALLPPHVDSVFVLVHKLWQRLPSLRPDRQNAHRQRSSRGRPHFRTHALKQGTTVGAALTGRAMRHTKYSWAGGAPCPPERERRYGA